MLLEWGGFDRSGEGGGMYLYILQGFRMESIEPTCSPNLSSILATHMLQRDKQLGSG